ncbi:MAG: hypothetical protein ACRCUY_07925 [Thermoguttaceae bacterium]
MKSRYLSLLVERLTVPQLSHKQSDRQQTNCRQDQQKPRAIGGIRRDAIHVNVVPSLDTDTKKSSSLTE